MDEFVKSRGDAPEGFFAAEAAGLAWLAAAEADGGVRGARVVRTRRDGIVLERVPAGRADPAAARAFGAALAATHDAGAAAFGAPPDGWTGPTFIGRRPQPCVPRESWGAFYVEQRVLPFVPIAVDDGALSAAEADVVERACTVIAAGAFDDDEPPARLHGDLWNGNVLWAPEGAVLIDPAAHGGHRETDLAMLALFGCPHLEAVLDGYADRHPLRPGRGDRVPLHQLHPLAVHAAGHGSAYGAALVDAARRVLALAS